MVSSQARTREQVHLIPRTWAAPQGKADRLHRDRAWGLTWSGSSTRVVKAPKCWMTMAPGVVWGGHCCGEQCSGEAPRNQGSQRAP